MTEQRMWEAIAAYTRDDGKTDYARIEHRGRIEWKTKRTAEKHARDYKARHLRDAWAQECA